jgi:hypothetical protein
MRGSLPITFLSLVRDTIDCHGIAWAADYYARRMPAWEARFWLRLAYLGD